jgi:methionine sulfoxide reductase heme-binding subunit
VRRQAEPISFLWWLVSRASGIVALVLISLSVIMGLAMATRILARPGAKRTLAKLHEHVALTALLAIGAHGLSLLGDQWLRPGWAGITVPFALGYRPQYTGIGIVGGYMAVLLGPSFYLRRRIGARRWRRLHTLIFVSWLLCAAHTLGAGSDAQRLWLRAIVFVPAVPIAYLLVLRLLRGDAKQPRQAAPQRTSPRSSSVASEKPPVHATEIRRRSYVMRSRRARASRLTRRWRRARLRSSRRPARLAGRRCARPQSAPRLRTGLP